MDGGPKLRLQEAMNGGEDHTHVVEISPEDLSIPAPK
jgi:hypothetical protein